MPKGIPLVKKDESAGLKYTTYTNPLVANPNKHTTTNYLRTDSQTLWFRNAVSGKAPYTRQASDAPEQKRGSQVLVIHPGSRNLRIGRASDTSPVTVPSVIARRARNSPAPVFVESILRPETSEPRISEDGTVIPEPNDPFEQHLAEITVSLHERMRFYKMRVVPNALTACVTFNQSVKPEVIATHNDAFQLEWIDEKSEETVLAGAKALRVVEPEKSGYIVRWPIYGSGFNTRDYSSIRECLGDFETLLHMTLKDQLNIHPRDYKNFSVVLLIPDLYDRAYVRELVQLLLVDMGFKMLCAQQESLGALFGTGISTACVVDIGAKVTSVACVEEGLLMPDSRISLNFGGDDITEFLHALFRRIAFPYRDVNLVRQYDWALMEDLKTRLCSLQESDVLVNTHDFSVRRPDRPTEKYQIKVYDEIIMAAMSLFEPRVIEFERKRSGFKPFSHPDVTEEIMEFSNQTATQAMMISTQHLFPPPPQPPSASEDGNDPTPAPPPSTDPTFGVDVVFEAGKLPLDVAIFNSVRAAGDDKIRKYLSAILVVGGTANMAGMAHAVESRLQAIATPLVPNMDRVQMLPTPRDVDAQILTWRGAATLAKMEQNAELWITAADWATLGMRGLKERCWYL
ncbi:actin-like ATPase domain-containing protein [Cylindrobasidium torrendii FP15055 ss-10]|uniref:Actin-like ATPase domain-containing protein n=1 Tax=Cylindrobasidium torrendii FP15055 ss-10 TaxID=1314674 RepID=A0A0D7B4C7_9AGAR|nr:actin-like ATPase domain-containing protein [Cylindrobasidium torrendii FP15055 ss-10]